MPLIVKLNLYAGVTLLGSGLISAYTKKHHCGYLYLQPVRSVQTRVSSFPEEEELEPRSVCGVGN